MIITHENILSINDLVELLSQYRGTKICSLITHTAPRMRKTGNPFYGEILKISAMNGMINFNYAGNVNKQRERENKSQDFQSSPSWFTHTNSFLVEHPETGQQYIKFRLLKNPNSVFYNTRTGQIIDRHQIEPYLYDSSGYESQDLDKPIRTITIKIENIKKLKVDGQEYEVEC